MDTGWTSTRHDEFVAENAVVALGALTPETVDQIDADAVILTGMAQALVRITLTPVTLVAW